MLQVMASFVPRGRAGEDIDEGTLTVCRMPTDGHPDYTYVLDVPLKDSVSGVIASYPRWSASVWDLVLRAIACALNGGKEQLPTPGINEARPFLGNIDVKVSIGNGRLVINGISGDFRLAADDMETVHGSTDKFGYETIWEGIARVIALGLAGDPFTVPVRPMSPLDVVPVYSFDDVFCIAFSDIPEPARSAFDRHMSHSTCPVIPGDPRMFAYAWDWIDFIKGQR